MMIVWVLTLVSCCYWVEMNARHEERNRALTTANAFFQQIVVSRLWNASHDGVYVPITTQTPPNKYLPSLNRDLSTDTGLKLTRINPSYMTRQMAELAKKNEYNIQFHLTSLNPIRPENKATDREEQWLKSFQEGVKEQGEFVDNGNTTWFHYMAPLLTKPSCLPCHAKQGYKEGDIRGGLSISIPYHRHSHLNLFMGYGSVALIGLILIFIGGNLYERRRLLFDATFNSPVPTCVTDKNFMILIANESYWAEFGALPISQKRIKCYDHRPGESCHTKNCPLTRIMDGSEHYSHETIKEKDGVSRHFIVTAKPLFDTSGKVVGSVESFQEITDRKRSEEALETLNRKLESLSNTDGLTGIANRRHFDEVLAQEYTRHTRSGANLSLILLDIDYFKLFNDSYGHVKGDECLQQVAQIITNCVGRAADLAARYGGEEFSCILPETNRHEAIIVAEKIRKTIMACAIPHQESKIADCVTASLGVVTVQCTRAKSATDIIRQVDRQLYLAKSMGRNRVETSAPIEVDEKKQKSLVELTWKDSFACGHEVIDSQHKSLFHLSNKLFEAILSEDQPKISEIITRLLEEVSQHFYDEQEILETINYPDIDQHITDHDQLLARGLELAEQFKSSTLTSGDIFQFLVYEMIKGHMLNADLKFFPFIEKARLS